MIGAMPDRTPDAFIENRTFDELTIGETASLSHTVTQRDIGGHDARGDREHRLHQHA